jgi:cell division protein FtsI/penicillin-binding protein 2
VIDPIKHMASLWASRMIRETSDRSGPAQGGEPPDAWRTTMRRRVGPVSAFLLLWVCGIFSRLVFLQVIDHAELVARAERQQLRTVAVSAKRGDIMDRHGRILATSVEADSIYAVPSEIGDRAATVAKLCRAFTDCTERERQTLLDRFNQQRAFVYVRRQVSPEDARRVAALDLDSIGFIKESRRFYPNRELTAHVLGYVGIDGGGLNGIESTYDRQVSGKPGTLLIQTDAKHHPFGRVERPPTSGSSIELTIDAYVQHIAERELHDGVVANHAAGGTAIVLDPKSGEILAMANEPTFNPNVYRDASELERRNKAVQDLYEPGSTFKVVTASAAIEEKVMPVTSMIDTSPGVIHIGPRAVREASGHNYGVLSFSDVLVKSSNVGAIKIGFRVGSERLSRYVERFGFGHPVSSDFPSENPGIVWDPSKWTESALASVSMGYQVGVTPLQMVTAVGSVANGGTLVEPHVVRAVYLDNRRVEVRPKAVRQTITPETAAQLTTIMEGVVERGTAKAAQIDQYALAGKTGTAAKLVAGHYSKSDYNASFVGFAPSRNPAVAILVVIDSPHGQGTTGGAVSAPIFKQIAEATLRYYGIPQTINPPPPVVVPRQGDGDGRSASAPSRETPIVTLATHSVSDAVPDLLGQSAREAVRALAQVGLVARISGDGAVAHQDPPPGAPIEAGGVCHLQLSRSALVGAGRP